MGDVSKEDMHDRPNDEPLMDQPLEMSGNSGSFSDHNNAESGGL